MDDFPIRACNERGQSYGEYALVLVVVVIVAIILLMLLGSFIEKWGGRIVDAVENPREVSNLRVTWSAEDRATRRARPTVRAAATRNAYWATQTAVVAGLQTAVAATQGAEATATREAETAPTRTVAAATREAEATVTQAAATATPTAAMAGRAAVAATQEAEATATRAAAVATLTARVEATQNMGPAIGRMILVVLGLVLGLLVWILLMTPLVRLVGIRLTDEKGRRLRDNERLIEQSTYDLHLEIQFGGVWGQAKTSLADWLARLTIRGRAAFRSTASKETPGEIGENDKTRLNVVFFSPEEDFRLERKVAALDLPRQGASVPIHYAITPQQAGRRRLRACVYYHNVLLQSVLLDASVQTRPKELEFRKSTVLRLVVELTKRAVRRLSFWNSFISRDRDYAASTDLTLLEELHQPALSIFTNQTTDGTHWIGVFAPDDISDLELYNGDMYTFGPGELETMAKMAREVLTRIQGQERYRLGITSSLDVQGRLDRLEKDLVELAVNGYTLYDGLFFSRWEAADRRDRLLDFWKLLERPSIISVARCRAEGSTIPWAALYAYYLDTNGDIRLCERFKGQLRDNEWSHDMTKLERKHDLLDDPERCRSDPGCPRPFLGDGDGLTVCPFGFWGFMHQVEQPLQQVTPTPADRIPDEMKRPAFSQTLFLERSRKEKVRLLIGAYQAIPNVEDHKEELESIGRGGRMTVEYEEERDRIREILEEGGHHLYYFYCHGEMVGPVFKLKLGPKGRPGYIAAADLKLPWGTPWSSRPQSLVILNACETLALVPERIHGLLGKLRLLGACGVVGSEVKVWSALAQPFGYQLVKRIVAGQSVGEAFLDIRRHLLRQFNPLGLAYSYYSPATLHLHDPDDCKWCRAHADA